MVFSDIIFLFYFLPAVLVIYFVVPKRRRNFVLFLGSLIFYAWGEPIYMVLLLLSAVFNFFMGKGMEQAERKARKKRIFIVSVAVNSAVLVLFKCLPFFIGLFNAVLPRNSSLFKLAVPVGISFYTLRALSYIIDVYRGKTAAQKSFIRFGVYMALFPPLIAGPVIQYGDIEQQLTDRRETIVGFSSGIMCFAAGLAKKVLLADNLLLLWNTVHATAQSELSVLSAWLGIVAFAFWIYFCLSGYSDMAIGLSRMFGFELEPNFRYPYTATSVTDFWRRWYISLGNWLKEYVCISSGGDGAKPIRRHLHFFVVWLFVGFWYGAGLRFLVWGLYYALLLIPERNVLLKCPNKLPKAVGTIYTLFFVCVGWVLFATNSLSESFGYLKVMFGFGNAGFAAPTFFYELLSNKVLLILSVIASLPQTAKVGKRYLQKNPFFAAIPVIAVLILCMAYLVGAA